MQTARVSSIAALSEFKASLQQYLLEIGKSLCEADLEFSRVRDWVNHDQPLFWNAELKKRHGDVQQAKDDLRRIQLSIAVNPPSAAEQKKALKVAQQREQEAMSKIKICKVWQRRIEQAGIEYRGQVQHIATTAESDLPRAITQLERSVRSLESYTEVTAPVADDEFRDTQDSIAAMSAGRSEAAIDPFLELDIEVCRAFRKIAPEEPERSSISSLESIEAAERTEQLELDRTDARKRRPAQIVFRDHVSVPRAKPKRGQRVIADITAIDAESIFLERTIVDQNDDSGWFIGCATRQRASAIETVSLSIADLLQIRPELREILSLPHGYLVVLIDSEIIRLLDPHDTDVWNVRTQGTTAEQSPPPSTSPEPDD